MGVVFLLLLWFFFSFGVLLFAFCFVLFSKTEMAQDYWFI